MSSFCWFSSLLVIMLLVMPLITSLSGHKKSNKLYKSLNDLGPERAERLSQKTNEKHQIQIEISRVLRDAPPRESCIVCQTKLQGSEFVHRSIPFIQCKKCAEKYEGSCSFECAKIAALPIEDQHKLRKDPSKAAPLKKYQKGIKPRLKELIMEREKANQKT